MEFNEIKNNFQNYINELSFSPGLKNIRDIKNQFTKGEQKSLSFVTDDPKTIIVKTLRNTIIVTFKKKGSEWIAAKDNR